MSLTEKEKKNREELFHLMQENPELPVVAMVDSDIVGDDGGYWLGSWGGSHIDEYLYSERAERYLFKSDDDVFDTLERYMSGEEFESLPESEEECIAYYDKLPWIKVIVVYINLPE